MWLLGGKDNSGTLKNDVWNTADGVSWTQITASANFSARSDHASAEFDSKMWVAGGHDGSNYLSDVWHSADGSTWTQSSTGVIPARAEHTLSAFNGMLWILGG